MPAEADPALVEIWARAWALTRDVAPPCPVPGGWHIEVGLPDQARRYVYPSPGAVVAERARSIDTPFTFLKVATSADAVRPLLPAGWEIGPPGFMMTATPTTSLPFDESRGYRLWLEPIAEHVTLATITTRNGELAASGRIGLVGDVGSFDRIRTQEAHQRRGLGSALMAALGSAANAAGAKRWVLVATPQGRALYEKLGWAVHVPYTTAFIPAP
ncbi:MAG: GNAT family N-acetyltransferase [Pseudomonadota bacterium]